MAKKPQNEENHEKQVKIGGVFLSIYSVS